MSYRKSLNHPKMEKQLFKNLPSEIVIDILSRLPVQTIISCKFVQKSWFHLVETQEFVESHLSKAVPGLIIAGNDNSSTLYECFEFEDGLDVKHHDFHYKLVTEFNLAGLGSIMGSVDGLLLLCKLDSPDDAIFICNPITRNYISLLCPQELVGFGGRFCTWGFGSSKMSGQYKVVRIFYDLLHDQETHKYTCGVECHVYTLGTGLWRRHASHPLLVCTFLSNGVFMKGNLHWLVSDLDCSLIICSFDLETERFSTIPAPPLLNWNGESFNYALNLFVWGDCLGLCDNTSDDEIVIWLMKEYDVEELWTKEFVMSNLPKYASVNTKGYPIKLFKDGDISILWNELFIYYSSKTKTTQRVDLFKVSYHHIDAILHTQSFLSLNSFGLENVSLF